MTGIDADVETGEVGAVEYGEVGCGVEIESGEGCRGVEIGIVVCVETGELCEDETGASDSSQFVRAGTGFRRIGKEHGIARLFKEGYC